MLCKFHLSLNDWEWQAQTIVFRRLRRSLGRQATKDDGLPYI